MTQLYSTVTSTVAVANPSPQFYISGSDIATFAAPLVVSNLSAALGAGAYNLREVVLSFNSRFQACDDDTPIGGNSFKCLVAADTSPLAGTAAYLDVFGLGRQTRQDAAVHKRYRVIGDFTSNQAAQVLPSAGGGFAIESVPFEDQRRCAVPHPGLHFPETVAERPNLYFAVWPSSSLTFEYGVTITFDRATTRRTVV